MHLKPSRTRSAADPTRRRQALCRDAYPAALRRRATIDANLIVDNFGVVPAVTGDAVNREMTMYVEAITKVGIGAHALAGSAHNGG
jgi:hypothetical protein